MHVRPIDAEPLTISRSRITMILLCCIALLSLLSFAGQVARYVFGYPFLMGFVPLFYVDLEGNLPTWYQASVFTLGSVLALIVHNVERRRHGPFSFHWLMLAGLLLAMSIDEASQIHELTMEPMARWFGQLEGAWRPMWVIVGLAAVAAVSLVYLKFFFHLDPRERLQVIVAAGLFVGGAVGVEMATATLFEVYEPWMKFSFRYAVMAHVEELCEMLGLVVFIDFLLQRVSRLQTIPLMVVAQRRPYLTAKTDGAV